MAEELAQTPAQTEAKLADQYLDGAVLARTVSYKALELALKQIEDGTLRDPAKTAMNAAITSGTLLDKRLLLQERPTQIVQTEDPKQGAQRLARRLGVTLETTAHDVETPTLPEHSNTTPAKHSEKAHSEKPLLSQGEPPKPAHARVVADRSRLGSGRVLPAD